MNDSHSIQPGDRVLLINACYFEEWNGTVGEVVAPLSYRTPLNLHSLTRDLCLCYKVRLADGTLVNAEPHQVRKLNDDSDPASAQAQQDLAHPLTTA